MTPPQVAVVMSGFPRRSETFALNELRALQERGILAGIFAAKHGEPDAWQPGCNSLMNSVEFLPQGTAAEQATVLVSRLANRHVSAIHGYFAHTPAEIAHEAARQLSVAFGFSMHAKDARKVTAAALLARGRAARCVVACNHDVAGAMRADGVAIHLIPHGVDLGRFRPMALIADSVFRVLAVGRLVEKKGFDVLIRAAARLAVPIAVRIVGEGPERKALEALIASESCVDRVNLAGPLTHDALPREYAWAHAVAVPSVVDATGDRDGLPNVVLEAMASGRPVVATRVGAIDSAVVNGLNGLLVKEGSVESLLEALHHMAAARRMQEAMGARGRSLVERKYGLEQCANNFCRVLENAYAS